MNAATLDDETQYVLTEVASYMDEFVDADDLDYITTRLNGNPAFKRLIGSVAHHLVGHEKGVARDRRVAALLMMALLQNNLGKHSCPCDKNY